jgi:DNA repair protein RadC
MAQRALREKLKHGIAFNAPNEVRDFLRLKIGSRPHEVFLGVFLDA